MIDTTRFDFGCGSEVKMLDANSHDAGDVTEKFVAYARKANRDLLERSFNGTDLLKDIPKYIKDFVAASESSPCKGTTPAGTTPR